MVAFVQQVLEDTGCMAEWLTLELTENLMVGEPEKPATRGCTTAQAGAQSRKPESKTTVRVPLPRQVKFRRAPSPAVISCPGCV